MGMGVDSTESALFLVVNHSINQLTMMIML